MLVNSYEEVIDAKFLNTRLTLRELQTHKHTTTRNRLNSWNFKLFIKEGSKIYGIVKK